MRKITRELYFPYVLVLFILCFLAILIKKGHCVLFINGLNCPVLDNFFPLITNLGDGFIFLPIVIILLFVRFQYAIIGTLITGVSAGISVLLKQKVFHGMARPRNFLNNDLLHFVPGVDVHGSNSFPSGHTITIFCAALFVTLISRNKTVGIACLTIAVLVGCSRIYLLQHFLMDVAAGAVVGCLITYGIWQAFELTRKPRWMSGRINLNLGVGTKSNSQQFDQA